MCKIVTERGMEEIGDPRELIQYGYSIALEAEHDPHWDPNELHYADISMKNSSIFAVKGLPIRITSEEETVVLRGRIKRGEKF